MRRMTRAIAVHIRQARLLAVRIRQPSQKMVETPVFHGQYYNVFDARVFWTRQTWGHYLRKQTSARVKGCTGQRCSRDERGILQQLSTIEFHEVTPKLK